MVVDGGVKRESLVCMWRKDGEGFILCQSVPVLRQDKKHLSPSQGIWFARSLAVRLREGASSAYALSLHAPVKRGPSMRPKSCKAATKNGCF